MAVATGHRSQNGGRDGVGERVRNPSQCGEESNDYASFHDHTPAHSHRRQALRILIDAMFPFDGEDGTRVPPALTCLSGFI
jgi:hypothetical protein